MQNRLPVWFRQNLPTSEVSEFSYTLQDKFGLNTVCHSAKCPNVSRCFSKGHVTFLILGNRCTRNCRFCAIEQFSIFDCLEPSVLSVDEQEPYRIGEACKYLDLKYVVITSVTRDDLPDGGAQYFADTIEIIKNLNPDIGIEVLIPDFECSLEALKKVVQKQPQVISHNLETVRRIYPLVRHKASYRRSLDVLRNIKSINPNQITKSSIMLGLGETDIDVKEALGDLRSVGCDMLVLGQYLRPSLEQYPVQKFYSPQEFKSWESFAYDLGFGSVCASPLARTSYLAKEQQKCMM